MFWIVIVLKKLKRLRFISISVLSFSNFVPEMTTRDKQIIYISENLKFLDLTERNKILGILLDSQIQHDKFQAKSSGTGIRYTDINDETLQKINDKVQSFIKEKDSNLKKM